MASYNLNEILKYRAIHNTNAEVGATALSDSARIRILSPMRQVTKRFARNRLASFGLITLAFMFLFSFLGPLFYTYGEADADYKYTLTNSVYSSAQYRTSFSGYVLDSTVQYNDNATLSVNAHIETIEASKGKLGLGYSLQDGSSYLLERVGDKVYKLSICGNKTASFASGPIKIGVYEKGKMKYEAEELGEDFERLVKEKCTDRNGGSFEFNGVRYSYKGGETKMSFVIYAEPESGFTYAGENLGEAFEAAAQATADGDFFEVANEVGSKRYCKIASSAESFTIYAADDAIPFMVYSNLSFDTVVPTLPLKDEFKANALLAISRQDNRSFTASAILDTKQFEADMIQKNIASQGTSSEEEATPSNPEYVNSSFSVSLSAKGNGIWEIRTATGSSYAEISDLVVRRHDGKDTMELDLKHKIREVIMGMEQNGLPTATFDFDLPEQDEMGRVIYQDNQLQKKTAQLAVTRESTGGFRITAAQKQKLLNIYDPPSDKHALGTDGSGFDVLARIMYGGRISLMLGFVVVLLECFLGVLMGGMAGYFGGWVDNLIMRVVDIFYCLPRLPIMIIIGFLMEAGEVKTWVRPFIVMVAMGFIGWANVARLVRGQILSLREQEYMIAAEATGLPVSRQIFRHLIPNVMPQLIVSATMGLGSAILTESTMSFLGLGVKHPLATWGSMIYAVSDPSAMEQYSHIWIPVGLMICLTIIAFNFVGDGLRDAFDPKAKK